MLIVANARIRSRSPSEWNADINKRIFAVEVKKSWDACGGAVIQHSFYPPSFDHALCDVLGSFWQFMSVRRIHKKHNHHVSLEIGSRLVLFKVCFPFQIILVSLLLKATDEFLGSARVLDVNVVMLNHTGRTLTMLANRSDIVSSLPSRSALYCSRVATVWYRSCQTCACRNECCYLQRKLASSTQLNPLVKRASASITLEIRFPSNHVWRSAVRQPKFPWIKTIGTRLWAGLSRHRRPHIKHSDLPLEAE